MNTKSIFLLCMWLFVACFLQAQDKMPQAISYQAVARDAQGRVVTQKPIGIQVEILKGSTTGTVVFSETHSLTSSKTGTVNLLIGQGTCKTGTFSSVDWGADTYFLQLSMDLNGGSNYEKVSTTQMLPVPYALYAAKAGEVENGGSGTTSANTDFLLVPDGSFYEVALIIGEANPEIVVHPQWGGEGIIFSVYILYLNGEDQNVEVTVKGLPDDTYKITTYPSAKNGRYVEIMGLEDSNGVILLPVGSYDVSYVFKNKYGLEKEFKCKYIRKE
ncbi:hypothetical protein [Parabacteroides goldsteinii]|uniref:hypothetical protein n=1 Tax=Parabacteroides goldsteinii TaxID=328812 RepID=UPI003AB51322